MSVQNEPNNLGDLLKQEADKYFQETSLSWHRVRT
jgi:hypothetical protein